MVQKLSAARILPLKESQAHSHQLPKELEVIVQDMTSDLPTHVLAIIPRKPPVSLPFLPTPPQRKISLHLSHDLLLALHCSSIPAEPLLARPRPTLPDSGAESTNLTLPVVPLALPDPSTFQLLHYYIYTKNLNALIASLIPLQPAIIRQGLPTISATLARTFTPTALAATAGRIHGVWANACSLGVWEEEMWDAIDLCWEAVMGALKNVAVGISVSVPDQKQCPPNGMECR
jgi:hypothetical protein